MAPDIPSIESQGTLPLPPQGPLKTELPYSGIKFLLLFVVADTVAPSQVLTISLRLLRKNPSKKDLIRKLGFKSGYGGSCM